MDGREITQTDIIDEIQITIMYVHMLASSNWEKQTKDQKDF